MSAYAALAQGQPLSPFTYDPGELQPQQVEIAITHCGICHTDIHLIDNDFGISAFPLVPGHEIVGLVTRAGTSVGNFQAGQRVGVGWQKGACMNCEWCAQGAQNLCAQSLPTCLAGYGGFATSIRVDSRFAIPVPDGLDSATAAPMLCAGITVYSPLSRRVRPGARVGVIGIGGLGHLALQFARAMGGEVFAFSTSPSKEEEARRYGAHHFVLSSDANQMQKAGRSLDFLLDTATATLDWPAWLATLRPNGTFCLVGAPSGPVTLSAMQMIFGQFRFEASAFGPPSQIAEMFRFAVTHNIRTAVEVVPLAEVNAALAKVRKYEARYRMVLAV
ncbi:MAG: NAD(P)-dependent alcohol dehydrogenase [Bryobacterales bacterium]|nr:NAD(P)-dependent alcohol dehydrogenase [Bryobacterales bacterium]